MSKPSNGKAELRLEPLLRPYSQPQAVLCRALSDVIRVFIPSGPLPSSSEWCDMCDALRRLYLLFMPTMPLAMHFWCTRLQKRDAGVRECFVALKLLGSASGECDVAFEPRGLAGPALSSLFSPSASASPSVSPSLSLARSPSPPLSLSLALSILPEKHR